jgi:hypothetical protein
MKRLTCAIASTVVALVLGPSLVDAAKNAIVVINRPTIVAFFPPVSPAELNAHPDTNEALADFQFYAARIRKPLQDAGIDFKEIYGKSFQVQRGVRITTFRPGKIDVGYYFVAPGRLPRIKYGVLTDTDLLQIAKEYFDPPSATIVATSGDCSQVEPIQPNLNLKKDTRVRGHLTDETREPFRNSPIELRLFVSDSEQVTASKVSTDGDGNFDLGVMKRGDYRLLLSPHRGFKQPGKLECPSNDCALDTVLIVNPTDGPGAGCPIR